MEWKWRVSVVAAILVLVRERLKLVGCRQQRNAASWDIAGIQDTLPERQHPSEPVVAGPTSVAISDA